MRKWVTQLFIMLWMFDFETIFASYFILVLAQSDLDSVWKIGFVLFAAFCEVEFTISIELEWRTTRVVLHQVNSFTQHSKISDLKIHWNIIKFRKSAFSIIVAKLYPLRKVTLFNYLMFDHLKFPSDVFCWHAVKARIENYCGKSYYKKVS